MFAKTILQKGNSFKIQSISAKNLTKLLIRVHRRIDQAENLHRQKWTVG